WAHCADLSAWAQFDVACPRVWGESVRRSAWARCAHVIRIEAQFSDSRTFAHPSIDALECALIGARSSRSAVMLQAGVAVHMVHWALVFALSSATACAQAGGTDNSSIYSYNGPDREQRLIAKAREEGTLVLYTSMATTESALLAQAFERRYGVKVQLWRALSENVLQRALMEARGHRRAMDVVETNAPEVEALAREQVIAQFDSPHVADLPAWAIPSHRRWFSDRTNLWVTGYNTAKVKRDELPVTLAGFADPAWKGRLSLE